MFVLFCLRKLPFFHIDKTRMTDSVLFIESNFIFPSVSWFGNLEDKFFVKWFSMLTGSHSLAQGLCMSDSYRDLKGRLLCAVHSSFIFLDQSFYSHSAEERDIKTTLYQQLLLSWTSRSNFIIYLWCPQSVLHVKCVSRCMNLNRF